MEKTNILRVLLINPNFRRMIGKSERISTILPPLGIAYIAAVLKKELKESADVKILDINALNLSIEQATGHVKDFNPDIVGLTAATPTINKCFGIAEAVKKMLPDAKIVIGGPHPTALPDESIKKDFIDFVALGEGEMTMLELAREIKNRKKDFKKIKGLVFKDKNKIIKNAPRERIKDLDALPFPAFELLPLEKYASASSKYRRFITILTSRGCPGQCNYCNKLIFGNACNMRSAENIFGEIEHLMRKYRYREFHIVDDLFTNDKKRIEEFCNMVIKKRMNIKWKCGNGVRVGTVDFELLKLMKKAGCYSLSYGIESGSQKILNNIRKGQSLQQCINAVKWTKQAGIECVGFFMLGNLGEDEKTMQETIDFAKSLELDIAQFSILIPFPGTPIRQVIENEGKIFENNWDKYDNLEGKAIFEHGMLKREMMERMYKKAYKEFYMRQKYMLKRIFRFRTLNEIKNEINGFLTLIEIK
ncbi:cobalamin B12-binding domain-containing protein [Candidatus Pacearchaeota archaeon]|nr:cobalamin B12-binding domain-containing protein [Candidatus Pacearchaeota archaeon]